MLKIATAAVILLVLLPARAQAEGWRTTRATEIARIVWHNPCVDRMRIEREPVSAAIARGELDAWDTLAWADEEDCVAIVSSDHALSWPAFCSRVLHEAGHLAQYRDPANTADPYHSDNPRSVMYSSQPGAFGRIWQHGHWVEAGGDPRCADRGRPYLERHGVLAPHALRSR